MKLLFASVVLLIGAVSVHAGAAPPLRYYCPVTDLCNTVDTAATCDFTGGSCSCDAYQGYNCQAPMTATDSGTFPTVCPDCDASGTQWCEDVSGTVTCYCKYYADNDDCSGNRVELVCNQDDALITINAHDGFSGLMYLLDATSLMTPDSATGTEIQALPKQPECELLPSAGVWTKTLEYTGPMSDSGCALTKATTDSGDSNYYFYVYVQQSQSIVASFDEIIKLRCADVAGSITGEVTGALTIAADPDVKTDANAVVNNVALDVTITVQNDLGAAITMPVDVGDPISIYIERGSTATYDFSMPELEALSYDPSGAAPTSTAQNILLVESWCLLQTATGVVTGITKDTGNPYFIRVSMNAFIFSLVASGDTGTVYFEIRLCKGGSQCSSQATTNCANPPFVDYSSTYQSTLPTTPGRKRRDAAAEEPETILDGELESINVRISVKHPSRTIATQNALNECTTDDKESCFNTLHFLLPLVTMGVILFLSLAMSIYFFKMTYRRSGNGGMTAAANQGFQHGDKL